MQLCSDCINEANEPLDGATDFNLVLNLSIRSTDAFTDNIINTDYKSTLKIDQLFHAL